MRLAEKLHALAATARIANVPSVAGNVFVGLALAHVGGHSFLTNISPTPALFAIVSGIGLYLSGNFLNDWADRHWDAERRPERALPQGLFRPQSYLAIAGACGLAGLGAAAAAHPHCLAIALALGLCIVIYTWVHKRTAWSVIPMGLCRALLPALGFSALAGLHGIPPEVGLCALGLFCHIAGLSLSARCETMPTPPAGLLRCARWCFVSAAGSMWIASWQSLSLPLAASFTGLLPYGLWIALCLTLFRKPVPVHVSNLLAGIPLVDWIVLLPLALALGMSGPFAIACMIVPPLAFLAGKALQRLAPAT